MGESPRKVSYRVSIKKYDLWEHVKGDGHSPWRIGESASEIYPGKDRVKYIS